MPDLLPERQMGGEPDRIVALVPVGETTDLLAERALEVAREVMPKVTGYLASTLRPIHGSNYFGIYFPDRRVWFLERGTRPFTMRSLAGRVVPMWIDDPTGSVRRENPKSKVRTTVDGRTQVLLIRRVGTKGGSKVARTSGGGKVARYPGAPGRISRREAGRPFTAAGRVGGQIARGNVGVAWRHPGTVGRQFLNLALTAAAQESGLDLLQLYLTNEASFFSLVRMTE